MGSILWLGFSYLLGAVPFGLIVARIFCGIDPRLNGSKNTGATNVARLCGVQFGLVVLALDIAKGFFPVFVATGFSESAFFWSLVGLTALIGHMHSVFLRGQGGKAVAATVGVYLALAPGPLLWAALLCFVVIFFSGFVSLGSLTLVTAMPVFLLLTGRFGWIFIFSLVVMALVYWKHRENIGRLARGEEKSWRKDKEDHGP